MIWILFLFVSCVYSKFYFVDFLKKKSVLKSRFSSIITWYSEDEWQDISFQKTRLKDRYPFLYEVQIFTATGGCYTGFPGCSTNRDLLSNPSQRNSTYDFSRMLKVIENVISMGFNPYIVTGNVPVSYSQNPTIGVFGVNKEPPVSYSLYFNYIQGFAKALLDKFGYDRVTQFRFGVLTEFNNFDWFTSEQEYLKLYDYTVGALTSILGEDNVQIGAHACTQCFFNKGGWDPTDFLKHVANGTNFYTGKKGTRMTFLANSFYENEPGKPGDLSEFERNIKYLQDAVEFYGLKSILEFGIDEGRILSGPKGLPLSTREVGCSYQASFDALFFQKMMEFGVDYYSRWNVNSQSLFGTQNVDTVASNVARLADEMFDSEVLEYKEISHENDGLISGIIPVLNELENELKIMIFCHDKSLLSKDSKGCEFDIRIDKIPFKEVNISVTIIDEDNAQYWKIWQEDIVKHNITSWITTWSKWTSNPQSMLTEKWEQDFFVSRVPEYQERAKLKVNSEKSVRIDDKVLKINESLKPHSVHFFVIKKIQ